MMPRRNGKPAPENNSILSLPVVRPTRGNTAKADNQADDFIWNEDDHAGDNYAALGRKLGSSGDLFRSPAYGNGILLVLADGSHASISRGPDLFPVIVDRLRVRVVKDGKAKGSSIPAAHLAAMLRSERFLAQFRAVDLITRTPAYLPDFTLAEPGYNDGGPGHRILYTGGEPQISDSLDTINAFLDVMDFETNADRTNAVAAALTVILRNFWPGGNPRHEFLPANREQIAAELRGMIERWKQAGMPLDEAVKHPFSPWAKTIGGILKVNGFGDFLANYGLRKTADDPVRRGLALLGAAKPDDWLGASDWAGKAVKLGLVKDVIPPSDQNSNEGRNRGIGVVLSAHRDETFVVETEVKKLRLRLEKKRARKAGSEPHVQYRFVTVAEENLPVAEEPVEEKPVGDQENPSEAVQWEDI